MAVLAHGVSRVVVLVEVLELRAEVVDELVHLALLPGVGVEADELHIHDLRHEAISRVADSGGRLAGGFSLVDLQAFSGHRDTRMLLRYTHLCMPSLAKRLDQAFASASAPAVHRGRRRLAKGSGMSMADLTNANLRPLSDAAAQQPHEQPSNVVQFRPRRVA